METQEDSYFVIHSGPDGISVEQINKDELIERIEPDIDENIGDCTYYGKVDFLGKIDKKDPSYWGGRNEGCLLIIKGRIVVPKPKEVITKVDID